MSLIFSLRAIAVKLEKYNENQFKVPVSVQKEYLAQMEQPKDDIERSYCQYRCQMRFYNLALRSLINVASLPLLILYRLKRNDLVREENCTNVFFADGKPESIIPDELISKVGRIKTVEEKRESLTKEDVVYYRNILKRYPFSWHFLLKCLMKIRFYSYEIQQTNPKCIIVCNEYSFTSSALTKYCENKGIQHINVMHGEKYYYIRDSFFRFHKCYVWDKYYVELFKKLRAEPTQFAVAIPKSLRIPDIGIKKSIDYSYYLADESGVKLKKIIDTMGQLKQKGYCVSIRPHPRYSNQEEVKKLAGEIEIEDNKMLTIEDSIRRTRNVISLCSTVLNQAYNSGVSFVIDDISDPIQYRKLEEFEYIMLQKEHKILSEILK